jgi:hypothetical protein
MEEHYTLKVASLENICNREYGEWGSLRGWHVCGRSVESDIPA